MIRRLLNYIFWGLVVIIGAALLISNIYILSRQSSFNKPELPAPHVVMTHLLMKGRLSDDLYWRARANEAVLNEEGSVQVLGITQAQLEPLNGQPFPLRIKADVGYWNNFAQTLQMNHCQGLIAGWPISMNALVFDKGIFAHKVSIMYKKYSLSAAEAKVVDNHHFVMYPEPVLKGSGGTELVATTMDIYLKLTHISSIEAVGAVKVNVPAGMFRSSYAEYEETPQPSLTLTNMSGHFQHYQITAYVLISNEPFTSYLASGNVVFSSDSGDLVIHSDQISCDPSKDILIAFRNVLVERNGKRLRAQKVKVDLKNESIDAEGNVLSQFEI